ncbi:MAG TPA: 30S ribosome-binding factor RbfA [Armatimonadota bacterium]|jgi:ribosome-binding factor A
MPTQRQVRINSLLQEEISRILLLELQDPELRLVSITGVVVSPDLRNAKVYASVMADDDEQIWAALAALMRNRKRIQSLIAHNVILRQTPRLRFVADRTAANAQRIETLLGKIAQEPPLPDAPEDEAPLYDLDQGE